MSKPAISYAPHASASPAAEISALRNVYSFVIKSSRAKERPAGAAAPITMKSRRGGSHDLVKELYKGC